MALTQKEIIEFDESNRDVIRLYMEGIFLKAYERSAFAFCTRVKDFKVLRKESKTLGRDILYVGFPAAAVEPTLSGCMTRRIDEKTIDVVLSYPIDAKEFLVWRDAKEVEMASRALISPYTRVIEKTPVYKIGYDILSQIILVSKNISKTACRGNIFRVFFIFDEGNVVLLFNGFTKKTQKTPRREIDLAKRLKKEYYAEKRK